MRPTATLPHPIHVSVPASSGNVGVGFDTLGLALDLRNSFRIEPAETLSVSGCEERFRGEDNLVWQTYRTILRDLGLEAAPVAIAIDTRIPLSGGLGSSSTCLVAGVSAALVAAGRPLERQEVIERAVAIEGFPDNVVAAVLGGLQAAFGTEGGELVCLELPVSDRWRFCVLCPPYEILTSEARKVLPASIALADAASQLGRVTALERALAECDGNLLAKALDDRLHEPYRKPLIADYDRARRTALEAGASGLWISGSGSTMIAACTSGERASSVLGHWEDAFPGYRMFSVAADRDGMVIGRA